MCGSLGESARLMNTRRFVVTVLFSICLAATVVLAGTVMAQVETADEKETVITSQDSETVPQAERERRAELRAFYTAPPIIPHNVTPRLNKDCRTCHAEIRELDKRTSVPTPHMQFHSCVQCHVPQHPPLGKLRERVETTWQGLDAPLGGSRAHAMAPPTVPHRTALREQCGACHRTDSPYELLRMSHPERVSCLQCHLLAGGIEFELE